MQEEGDVFVRWVPAEVLREAPVGGHARVRPHARLPLARRERIPLHQLRPRRRLTALRFDSVPSVVQLF
jgi:hypothetical protein